MKLSSTDASSSFNSAADLTWLIKIMLNMESYALQYYQKRCDGIVSERLLYPAIGFHLAFGNLFCIISAKVTPPQDIIPHSYEYLRDWIFLRGQNIPFTPAPKALLEKDWLDIPYPTFYTQIFSANNFLKHYKLKMCAQDLLSTSTGQSYFVKIETSYSKSFYFLDRLQNKNIFLNASNEQTNKEMIP